MLLTNRHVVIALIVAPILAVLAWQGVGQLNGEKPRAAQPGNAYPLVEHSNCRWHSGQCTVSNQDIELQLSLHHTTLAIRSSRPLARILVAIASATTQQQPVAMVRQGDQWQLDIQRRPGASDRLRLVAAIEGTHFFAEVSTAFATEN